MKVNEYFFPIEINLESHLMTERLEVISSKRKEVSSSENTYGKIFRGLLKTSLVHRDYPKLKLLNLV